MNPGHVRDERPSDIHSHRTGAGHAQPRRPSLGEPALIPLQRLPGREPLPALGGGGERTPWGTKGPGPERDRARFLCLSALYSTADGHRSDSERGLSIPASYTARTTAARFADLVRVGRTVRVRCPWLQRPRSRRSDGDSASFFRALRRVRGPARWGPAVPPLPRCVGLRPGRGCRPTPTSYRRLRRSPTARRPSRSVSHPAPRLPTDPARRLPRSHRSRTSGTHRARAPIRPQRSAWERYPAVRSLDRPLKPGRRALGGKRSQPVGGGRSSLPPPRWPR